MTSPDKHPGILLLAADVGAQKLDSYALMVASRDILSVLYEHAQEGLFEGTLERMDPGAISGLAAVLLEGSLGDRKRSAPQIDTVPLLASMDRAELQDLAASILNRAYGEEAGSSRFAHTLGTDICEALDGQIDEWQTRYQLDDELAP